jgi:anti-sigma regulatory factor (Ser/Thr protein kinase)
MNGAGETPVGSVAQVLLERSFDTESLHDLRQEIRRRLVSAGVAADATENFVFAINEGLINAIMHGGGGGDLTLLKTDGRVVATVEDHRPTAPFELADPPAAADDHGWAGAVAGVPVVRRGTPRGGGARPAPDS